MTWILDLDGVVWLGDEAVPGAADAVARLRRAGERVLFVTNNSAFRVGDQEAKLAGFGIAAEDDVLTSAAAAAARSSGRLIGTTDDATYPTPDGPIPGGGALLAAVAVAAGVRPEVAGKPHGPMVALARAEAGDGPLTVVGDRPSTDGGFARALGARFALVLSGVTAAGDLPVDPRPDVVAADLAALVAAELAQR